MLEKAINEKTLSHAVFLAGDSYVCSNLVKYACSLLFSVPKEKVNSSPDYIFYKGNDMKVSSASEISDAMMRLPYSGSRVIELSLAGQMPEDVQNKLLKTLEEPPQNNYFFLYGIEEGLLPTVRSRCVRMNLGSLTTSHIAEIVLSEAKLNGTNLSEKHAYLLAAMSAGSVQTALKLALDSDYFDKYCSFADFICQLDKKPLLCKQLDDMCSFDRDTVSLAFEVFSLCAMDMLRVKYEMPLLFCTHDKIKETIKSAARRLSVKRILCLCDCVSRAKERIYSKTPAPARQVFYDFATTLAL